MEIRRANARDIPEILELLGQVEQVHHLARPDLFRAGARKYDAPALERLLTREDRPVFVAMEGGAMLGYCFCVRRETVGDPVMEDYLSLYIDDLCVDEAHRGRHVGTRLYDHARNYAKAIGCKSVTLNVWADNKPALDFYIRLGLRPQKIGMESLLED